MSLVGIAASVIGLLVPGAVELHNVNINYNYNINAETVYIQPGDEDNIDSGIPVEVIDDTVQPAEEFTKIETDEMFVELKVRNFGTTEWKKSVDADVGDEVEFIVNFFNLITKPN